MQQKVRIIEENVCDIIAKWPGIQAIILGQAAEIEIYDPYFRIDLLVFYSGDLLSQEKRRDYFGNQVTFTQSGLEMFDDFLIDELPITVTYRSLDSLETVLDRIVNNEWKFRDDGTKRLYDVLYGRIVFQKKSRIDGVRTRLKQMPERYWRAETESLKYLIELYLNDMGAAVFRNDLLFFTVSYGKFIKSLCSFLFSYNKQYEPPARMIFKRIRELPVLPDEFMGRFESLISYNEELTPEKKREIATLITKSIIHL